jgi:hypothetical protein
MSVNECRVHGDDPSLGWSESSVTTLDKIFASWDCSCFESHKKIFGLLFFRRKKLCILVICSENGLGYILGDFLQSHLVTLRDGKHEQ